MIRDELSVDARASLNMSANKKPSLWEGFFSDAVVVNSDLADAITGAWQLRLELQFRCCSCLPTKQYSHSQRSSFRRDY